MFETPDKPQAVVFGFAELNLWNLLQFFQKENYFVIYINNY